MVRARDLDLLVLRVRRLLLLRDLDILGWDETSF